MLCGLTTSFPFVSETERRRKARRDEEVIATWLPKAVAMAKARGCVDYEAAGAEALTIILDKGYLDRWDSTKGTSLNTYVFRMVELKLFSWRRGEKRRLRNEALSMDACEEPPSWASAVEDGFDSAEQREDLTDLITVLRMHDLGEVGAVPLIQLFETMAELAAAHEPITDWELSKRLGTSCANLRKAREALGAWVWKLRETVELRRSLPALDVALTLPGGNYDGMTKGELRAFAGTVLKGAGGKPSWSYYLSKGEILAMLQAKDTGASLAPYLQSAQAAYAEHQESLKAQRRALTAAK